MGGILENVGQYIAIFIWVLFTSIVLVWIFRGKGQVNVPVIAMLLVYGLISMSFFAYHGSVKRFEWLGMSFEVFQRNVDDVTKEAIAKIQNEAEQQKKELQTLERNFEKSRFVQIISHDGNLDLSESDMKGYTHRVMGPYTLTLPPAKLGLSGYFVSQVADAFSIKAGPNDQIVLAGTELPKGNKITSDGYNSVSIYLRCLEVNKWEASSASGLFVDGGS
jgi:hypothetical protein